MECDQFQYRGSRGIDQILHALDRHVVSQEAVEIRGRPIRVVHGISMARLRDLEKDSCPASACNCVGH
jgi:hypothetical protein